MKTLSSFILFLCFNAYCMDPDTAWKIQSIASAKNISISQELVELETIHNKNVIKEISAQYYLNLGECYSNAFKQIAWDIKGWKRKAWNIDISQVSDAATYNALSRPILLSYDKFADFVTLAANRKRAGNISMGEIFLSNLIRPQKKEWWFVKLIDVFYNTDEQEKYADWAFIKKFEKID